jgi:dTMP kinase
VVCDRFYDSTIAYQGYGRGLDLAMVRAIINFAVGETRPDVTLLLQVPPELSAARLAERYAGQPVVRDRFEEADRAFFKRAEAGFAAIAAAEPGRIRVIDASGSVEVVAAGVWGVVEGLL